MRLARCSLAHRHRPPNGGVSVTVALFRRRSGTHEDADPGAVAEVVELCGCLPLVIKVSAARLRV